MTLKPQTLAAILGVTGVTAVGIYFFLLAKQQHQDQRENFGVIGDGSATTPLWYSLPGIRELLSAGNGNVSTATGEAALPEYSGVDSSVSDIAAVLQRPFLPLLGTVIGNLPPTPVVQPLPTGVNSASTTTQLSTNDPDVVALTNMVLKALGSTLFSVLMQGSPQLTVTTQGSVMTKVYTLDLFLYDKVSNYVPHVNVVLRVNGADGSVELIQALSPDLVLANNSNGSNGSSSPQAILAKGPTSGGTSFGSFDTMAQYAGPSQPFAPLPSGQIPTGENGSPFLCFGSMDVTAQTASACRASGGVWDSPVTKDSDCPYFQANQNYDNTFGGARNRAGYCEVPSGMNLVGFRNATGTPNCYNCKNPGPNGEALPGEPGFVGPCCDDQRQNVTLYPGLKSPDYQYPGDQFARIAGASQLAALGLSVK